MTAQKNIWVGLILLAVIDTVIPLPITALLIMVCIWQQPEWFRKTVLAIIGR